MKFVIICFFVSICALGTVTAQKTKIRGFRTVIVPDSIRKKLANSYGEGSDTVNWILNNLSIGNLKYPDNLKFINGIYIYNLFMTSDSDVFLFVYKNGKLFIIACNEFHNPVCFIEKFLKCIKELNLSDREIRNYLLEISKYLHEYSASDDPYYKPR